MEKQKCPEVRFNQFNGSWFEKNLSNEVSFYSGLTYSPNDITNKNGTLVLRSSNVQNGEISLLDNVYVRSEVAYSQNVDEGDIIVVVRNGSRSLIGKHATIKNKMINTVIGAFMTGVKSSQPDFINALFDSNNFTNQVNRNLGATINQITIGAFKEMNFYFPQEEEKVQIGEFFQNLDQSIALHEKKLAQTQNFKKAMLEKMFPKQGILCPEIRLKGFSGDWSSYSIFDLANNNTLSNGVFNDQNKVGKGYKLINVLDMYLETSIDENRLTLLDLDKREFEQNKVNYGDIFFTRSSLVKEGIAFSNVYLGCSDDVTYDGHLIKLSPNLNIIDPIFLNYCLKSSKIRKQLILGGKSTTMTTIGQQEVGSTLVDIPSIQEQKKIGIYFKKIDETLNLQQQQLQTLKNIKQALLEKMFV